MDIRSLQKPLKAAYRDDPPSSRITLVATGAQGDAPVSSSVEVGRAPQAAEAHPGVGGPGAAACSGDLLLGPLAACAQIACQMVAAAMEIPVEGVGVKVEGDLDLHGTLGTCRDVPVGFEEIRMRFDLDAPDADPAAIASLQGKAQRYCAVMQTLAAAPPVATSWS